MKSLYYLYSFLHSTNFHQSNQIRTVHQKMKFRSSHKRCPVKKAALKNFPKFTGKHLRQSLFFNKVAGFRPATLFKKRLWLAILLKIRLWHRCFPVNFVKFLRTHFLQNPSGWLLSVVINNRACKIHKEIGSDI